MYKKVILIVVGLLIVAAIAYAQGGFEGPYGGDPMGGPQPGQMGMPGMPPGMGQMMPGMGQMPGSSPIMVVNGNFIYIMRGDQVIKLDGDLKVMKQVMLPRPNMRGPQNPPDGRGGENRQR